MKEIYVRNEDGMYTDITEGVQAMYDIVINTLDWGSGLLTLEDAIPIANLSKACGFKDWKEAERYVTKKQPRKRK